MLLEHMNNIDSDYALAIASEKGRLDIVTLLLLKYKANLNANNKTKMIALFKKYYFIIRPCDNYAIVNASKYNNLEIVKLLLIHGADANVDDNSALKCTQK